MAAPQTPQVVVVAPKKDDHVLMYLVILAILGVGGYFGYKWIKKNCKCTKKSQNASSA